MEGAEEMRLRIERNEPDTPRKTSKPIWPAVWSAVVIYTRAKENRAKETRTEVESSPSNPDLLDSITRVGHLVPAKDSLLQQSPNFYAFS